jgi:hypothetical protein
MDRSRPQLLSRSQRLRRRDRSPQKRAWPDFGVADGAARLLPVVPKRSTDSDHLWAPARSRPYQKINRDPENGRSLVDMGSAASRGVKLAVGAELNRDYR